MSLHDHFWGVVVCVKNCRKWQTPLAAVIWSTDLAVAEQRKAQLLLQSFGAVALEGIVWQSRKSKFQSSRSFSRQIQAERSIRSETDANVKKKTVCSFQTAGQHEWSALARGWDPKSQHAENTKSASYSRWSSLSKAPCCGRCTSHQTKKKTSAFTRTI